MSMLPDAERFEPIIELLRARSRQYFGARDAAIIPLRYDARPFSYLLRAAVRLIPLPCVIYIKILKAKPGGPTFCELKARVQRDFDATSRVFTGTAQDAFAGTVPPVACFPERLCIVTKEVEGINGLDLLVQSVGRVQPTSAARDLEAVFESIGHWLRRYQQIEQNEGTLSLVALREYIDLRLRRLTGFERARFNERDRGRVLDHIDRLCTMIIPSELVEVAVHGDFTPANLLTAGRRITVLDFAMNGRGAIYNDLARLHSQMDLLKLKPTLRESSIGTLQAAALRGFDPDLTCSRALFQLLLLLNRVNHFGTMSSTSAPFPANLYNYYVLTRSRRWIRRMVEGRLPGSGPA